MRRGLHADNLSHVQGSHVHEVILAKLEFGTPVYVHSGIGTITYDSNDYVGVGDFGTFSAPRESETLGPVSVTLTLSGFDATFLTEALDASSYGDKVTLFAGYRSDDGTLVADPWPFWKGRVDYMAAGRGATNSISLIAQHDLSVLGEIDGAKFSDEDQRQRYSSDQGFEFVAEQATMKLTWGRATVNTGDGDPTDLAPWDREDHM